MSEESGTYNVRQDKKILIKTLKIDTETGEVLNQYQYFQDDLIRLRSKTLFTKLFHSLSGEGLSRTDDRPDIFKVKGQEVKGFCWFVLQTYYIEPNTNKLVKVIGDGRSLNNLKTIPLSFEDMIAILNIKKTLLYDFLALCDEHALIRKYDGEYYANPYYGYNGKGIVPYVCGLFYDCKKLRAALSLDDKKKVTQIKEKWEALSVCAKTQGKDSSWYEDKLRRWKEIEDKIEDD